MSAEAYLLLAENHHRSVYLEQEVALGHVLEHHHAHLIELVRADTVMQMLKQAVDEAYARGRKDEHDGVKV